MRISNPVLLGPPLQNFYRLFVYPYVDEPERFQVNVRADSTLARKDVAHYGLDIHGIDNLIEAVTVLGASAWSHFIGETSLGVPVFEPVACTQDELRTHVSDERFPSSQGLTLLVLNASPAELEARVQALRNKPGIAVKGPHAA
jgi:hypothetical protein